MIAEQLSLLSILPNELLIIIFKLLPVECLIRISSVCKRWNWLIFSLIRTRVRLRMPSELNSTGPSSAAFTTANRTYPSVYICGFSFHNVTPMQLLLCSHATEIEIDVNVLHEAVLSQLLPSTPALKRLTVRAKCLVVEGTWRTVELRDEFPSIENVSVVAESFFMPKSGKVASAGAAPSSKCSRWVNSMLSCYRKGCS